MSDHLTIICPPFSSKPYQVFRTSSRTSVTTRAGLRFSLTLGTFYIWGAKKILGLCNLRFMFHKPPFPNFRPFFVGPIFFIGPRPFAYSQLPYG